MKAPSINYFGDIIVESEEVTCMFISNDDMTRIPVFELENMRKISLKRIQSLQYAANRKYGVSLEQLGQY